MTFAIFCVQCEVTDICWHHFHTTAASKYVVVVPAIKLYRKYEWTLPQPFAGNRISSDRGIVLGVLVIGVTRAVVFSRIVNLVSKKRWNGQVTWSPSCSVFFLRYHDERLPSESMQHAMLVACDDGILQWSGHCVLNLLQKLITTSLCFLPLWPSHGVLILVILDFLLLHGT